MRTIDDLNQELLELKSCQLDLIKLAIKLFSFVSMFLGGLISILDIENGFKNISGSSFDIFYFTISLIFISILLITVISFPLFMRIILHKCRSIFRILGYIRLYEETKINNQEIYPYELLYSVLRCQSVLRSRIVDDSGLYYYFWIKPKEIVKEIIYSYKRVPRWIGLPIQEQDKLVNIYTGRYYKNLWFFLKVLCGIHLIILYSFLFILINNIDIWFYKLIYYILMFGVFLWCLYNERLLSRYFYEIHYFPFSLHSWYCLFKIVNENFDNQLCTAQFNYKYIECLTNRCT